ncbi:MAG: class I SAM-dependent methyltransferase [Proteobacteria bacterium]|nr:class I SAM-dependent methyltransferase [Pseudomonadota bacterium]MDA0928979.1 class I SAM-dependent methyltransferase [Pseudomonadota bacterium]
MSAWQHVALMQQADTLSAQESNLVNSLAISHIPVQQLQSCGFRFILRYEKQGLTLYSTHADAPGGLCVDFASRDLQRRRKESLKAQNLGKALGLKSLRYPVILDATAGLGTDSFLFSAAGCQVVMLERNPLVHALLADGLDRAANTDGVLRDITERMRLQQEDFLHARLDTDAFDVVYLDPMFPAKKKSAKSGKGMFLLQQLVADSADEIMMLQRAMQLARKRVVVKRAKLSPTIGELRPDISFIGSSNRFDVYLS